jgi:hypothetical protein
MAVTLADLAVMEKSPFAKAVIMDLLRKSDILNMVSVETVPGLRITGRRWKALPTMGNRKIGGSYTASDGDVEEVAESLFIYGGEVKVDRVLQLAAGSLTEAPVVTQTRMMVESLAYKFNYDFITGDHTVDVDTMEGLKVRVANGPARMTVELDSAGDALKVLASTANEQTFLDGVHELVYKTGANALIMNEDTLLKFGAVLRRVGLLSTATDAFDRVWDKFGGARLLDVGVKSDLSTEIITSTEDPGDGGNDSTSIYGVRFGGDDGLRVLQLDGSSVRPYSLGESDSGPWEVHRIDWTIGLENVGRYAVGRLCGFKMAAA